MPEWDHVQSDVVAQGSDAQQPLVTIAIPTYRRPDLLIEAVESALSQRFERPFEIIIVDNDPESTGAAALVERLPELLDRSFRYLINRENLGMFGNFNRCIQLARGEWLTIVNDDDILYPDYLAKMFAALETDSAIDGIVCLKRGFNERYEAATQSSLPRQLAKRALLELFFAGRQTRRLTVDKFFWGAVGGNMVGFLFPTRHARALGGFYPEEYPSDAWFYARFAKHYDLRQHRAVATGIRFAANESAKPGTLKAFLSNYQQLHETLLQAEVPRWWRLFSPLVLARDRAEFSAFWGVDIPDEEMEQMLNRRLPPHRPSLLWAVRLLTRGF